MKIGISALAMTDERSAARAGIARYAQCLIGALQEIGSDHDFVVAHADWFRPPESWLGRKNWRFEVAEGPFRHKKTLWDSFSARSFVARHSPDVWLSTAHAIPVFTGATCALTVHDLLPFQFPEHFTLRHRLVIGWALSRSIRRADRILAVSSYTASEITRRFGVSPARIDVTPLGPGNVVARREPAYVSDEELEKLGLPWPRYLLSLGTLEPRKNLRRLIEAFASVANAPECADLGLAIAGGAGWSQSKLPEVANKLRVGSRVVFMGYVPDAILPTLMARCEAFVFPSISEGFGLPVLEAMLLGAPVACSRTSSLPEVGGDACVYFDPANVQSIADAILAILRTPMLRSERVQAGLAQASQFSWERCARLTLQSLERAASERR